MHIIEIPMRQPAKPVHTAVYSAIFKNSQVFGYNNNFKFKLPQR